MIVLEQLAIPDVSLVHTPVYPDPRGALEIPWNADDYASSQLDVTFVQDLISHNPRAGTVRGMHFQIPPHAQSKLVRVVSGRIFDVVVDVRATSKTYAKSVCVELVAGSGRALFVPEGFAHGFCTLEDDTCVLYKIAGRYAHDSQWGFAWNDPDLAVEWPVDPETVILSAADRTLPRLTELPPMFL